MKIRNLTNSCVVATVIMLSMSGQSEAKVPLWSISSTDMLLCGDVQNKLGGALKAAGLTSINKNVSNENRIVGYHGDSIGYTFRSRLPNNKSHLEVLVIGKDATEKRDIIGNTIKSTFDGCVIID